MASRYWAKKATSNVHGREIGHVMDKKFSDTLPIAAESTYEFVVSQCDKFNAEITEQPFVASKEVQH